MFGEKEYLLFFLLFNLSIFKIDVKLFIMKNLKKNFFSIGLAFSMILGIAFSFVPQEANARNAELSQGARKCYTKSDNDTSKSSYFCNGNSPCQWAAGDGSKWRKCN